MPEAIDNDHCKHIAVLAFPFGTHAAPLLSLVKRISAAVPEAKFSFFNTAQSNSSLFAKEGAYCESIKPCSVSDGLPEDYKFTGNPQEPVEFFLKEAQANYKEAMWAVVEEMGKKITCLMSDAFLWFGADLAEEFGVPWLPLWTSGPGALALHVETDLIRQKMGIDAPKDKTLDFLPGLSEIRAMDIQEGVLYGDLNSPFAVMLHKMGQEIPRATAVAINSFEDLDTTSVNTLKAKFRMFLNVGPSVLTSSDSLFPDKENTLEWLDKQERKSVVYISFGSVIQPATREIEAIASALEESGLCFLWSLRGNSQEKLPDGFSDRNQEKGKIVSWTPQLKVLQHDAICAFVTHGGWNSILESIIGCVPMICRPFFGDQQLNARKIEAIWKIGVVIEGEEICKDGVLRALDQVTEAENWEKMRKKLEEFRDLAVEAVQPDGSYTKNFNELVEIVTK